MLNRITAYQGKREVSGRMRLRYMRVQLCLIAMLPTLALIQYNVSLLRQLSVQPKKLISSAPSARQTRCHALTDA